MCFAVLLDDCMNSGNVIMRCLGVMHIDRSGNWDVVKGSHVGCYVFGYSILDIDGCLRR